MIGLNDLKNYVISDITKKYDDVNQKIIRFTKLYFYTMKNHSYQLGQIENKLNEYNVNGEVKIKLLLENQQNIIKELIKIINNFLLEKRNSEVVKKLEEEVKIDKLEVIDKNVDCLPLKQKNIIRNNNNFHIFDSFHYPIGKSIINNNNIKAKMNINENAKNVSPVETLRTYITKSVDDKIKNKKIINQKKIIPLNIIAPKNGKEFNGAVSFLNIKSSKQTSKKKLFGKFVNKEAKKNIIKPVKKKIFKSISTSEISYMPKIINNTNLYLKTNNMNNNINYNKNPYYINNNYTIDEEKTDNINDNIGNLFMINERQNSINSINITENYGNLPHIFSKRKKRIKYRGNGGRGKMASIEKESNKNMVRVKSAKEISMKTDLYLNSNSSFPTITLNNSSIDKNTDFSYNKRSNSFLNLFKGKLNYKIRENNSIKKFENDSISVPYSNVKKNIFPSRFTKESFNGTFKKLNNYGEN